MPRLLKSLARPKRRSPRTKQPPSSELGDNISLSDTLDDRARPVDKEVFLRQLHFYEIRAGKSPDQG